MRYIALLRGINVGGRNGIKMPDLKKTFELDGFKNVRTYVQSGNVVFDHPMDDGAVIKSRIEESLKRAFKLSVETIIRTKDEFDRIVVDNPFIKEPGIGTDRLHVTFLADAPNTGGISALDTGNLMEDQTDRYHILSREIYLYCPNGYGRTKLTNALFERRLNTAATTRNWKTVLSLSEISRV